VSSPEERRRLKREYREQEKVPLREAMPLTEPRLNALLDFLDERLRRTTCDHTPQLTRRWAAANGVPEDELVGALEHFGGYCDCEALANVDPEEIF
jgi:Protein of unknown function (DUF2695)